MNNIFALCVAFLFILPVVSAARQYVEIERRPNNNHDLAGKFIFAFGLVMTFIAFLVALLFIGAFLRASSSVHQPPAIPTQIPLPSISTAIADPNWRWK